MDDRIGLKVRHLEDMGKALDRRHGYPITQVFSEALVKVLMTIGPGLVFFSLQVRFVDAVLRLRTPSSIRLP